MQPPLYGGVTIIGINEFNPPSAGQTVGSLPEKFDGPLIQILQLALGTPAPDKRRDRVDKEAKFTLAFLKVLVEARAFEGNGGLGCEDLEERQPGGGERPGRQVVLEIEDPGQPGLLEERNAEH